jgi:hypothetical protein
VESFPSWASKYLYYIVAIVDQQCVDERLLVANREMSGIVAFGGAVISFFSPEKINVHEMHQCRARHAALKAGIYKFHHRSPLSSDSHITS